MRPQLAEYGRKNTENVWISGTFQVLLDKDGNYADVGRTEENLLFYEVPDGKEFEGCCSEFFWVLKTCAEYVLRKEIPAAMFYLNLSVRDVLNRMVRWYICLKNKRPVEPGILDSYLERYLPEEIWDGYCRTYACAEQASLWNALDEMTELFHRVGVEVAAKINTAFPDRQKQAMLDFITRLKNGEL